MSVGVVVQEIVGHGVRHLSRHLRSTRSIEVGNRVSAVVPLERREVSANGFDRSDLAWRALERGHGRLKSVENGLIGKVITYAVSHTSTDCKSTFRSLSCRQEKTGRPTGRPAET